LILNIDLTGKDIMVTKRPEPKLDQHGEPRLSKTTGEPLWRTEVVVTDSSGGEVISVNTNGQPNDLEPGDSVEITGMIAIPWFTNGRSGVAFRADSIKMLD
jgi:hypothetical protein